MRAVVLLPGGKVRRFRSIARLQAFMDSQPWSIVSVGSTATASAQELEAQWRRITRRG